MRGLLQTAVEHGTIQAKLLGPPYTRPGPTTVCEGRRREAPTIAIAAWATAESRPRTPSARPTIGCSMLFARCLADPSIGRWFTHVPYLVLAERIKYRTGLVS
jgi:hypothetical protein